ncbi:MAG: efflux RND transporter periplasmic adaptor subunit [Planctomycetota bacterium]|nr:efflux RND transporter periplasmic adaptor subunit [Planctomycetota bacterium]
MAPTAPTTTVPRRTPKWLIVSAKIGAAVLATGGIVVVLFWLAGKFHEKVRDVVPESVGSRAADGAQAEVRLIQRPRFETAIGTIKPVHESAIGSKLLARVAEVHVKAGQSVERDELLVKLDDADLQSRLAQAEAVEASAIARKQQADADYARVKQLLDKRVVSQADYDQSLAAMKTATSEVERARQAIRETRVILEYSTLRSPLTGTVVDKRVEVGDTVTPGQVLLTLYDPTHMQMVATVRESLALRLSVGQKLPARLESLGYECEATVSEIVPEAQAASRSFTVKVIGPCPPGVYSGMFGRLLLPLEQEEVLVVPTRAVRQVGQLTLVDVVSDGRAQRRAVQLGRTFDDDVEVLSGLRPNERVIVSAEPAAKGSR